MKIQLANIAIFIEIYVQIGAKSANFARLKANRLDFG